MKLANSIFNRILSTETIAPNTIIEWVKTISEELNGKCL